jgi:hypothetical protein
MCASKLNLIGGPFQHAYSSTLWKKSKYIEWDYNSKNNSTTFYVDKEIFYALSDKNDGKLKFGWLLESRLIVPGLIDAVIANKDALLETFESIFTHNQRLLELDEKFKWCPAYGTYVDDPKIYDKTKLTSMITSNKTMTRNHHLRNHLASVWKDKLDLYGRGYSEIDKKEEGLAEYMFSVAIENDCYKTYFTEKITDCFAVGTIPVYLGAPDIDNHFNKDGIVFLNEDFDLNELTKDLYYKKRDAVQDNFERVLQYDVLEDWIYETYFK